jgi:predicted PurR-regulated permease PerM
MDPRPEPAAAPEASPAKGEAPARGSVPASPPRPPRGALRRRPPGSGWRSGDVLRAAAIVLALWAVFQLAVVVHILLLTAFLGLLFGLAVARGADYLNRWHVPRSIAAVLLVLSFYAVLFAAGAAAAPVLGRQFEALRQRLPEATDRVEQWLAEHRLEEVFSAGGTAAPGPAPGAPAGPAAAEAGAARGRTATGSAAGPGPAPAGAAAGRAGSAGVAAPPAAGKRRVGGGEPGAAASPATGAPGAAPGQPSSPQMPSQLRRTLARQLGAATRFLFPFLSSTLEALGGVLLITFIAIYFGIDPGTYRRGILHLVPGSGRQRADEVMTAIGNSLRRWLLAQLIAMVVIGVAVGVALTLLGVEAAISLGIIAGLLEFIPTIGPILAAMPAIAMGFLVSPQKALAVAIVFTLLQQLEGNLLIPVLMKHGVELPPLLTILGQAVLAVIFGFLGLVIAVPLLAAIMVMVKMLYVEDVVGDEIHNAVGSG